MLKKITLNLLKLFINKLIKIFVILLAVILLVDSKSFAQFEEANNCQNCYLNFNNEAAIQQCLIDYNCVNDIPIDNGVFFLFLAGILLIYITFKNRFKTVS